MGRKCQSLRKKLKAFCKAIIIKNSIKSFHFQCLLLWNFQWTEFVLPCITASRFSLPYRDRKQNKSLTCSFVERCNKSADRCENESELQLCLLTRVFLFSFYYDQCKLELFEKKITLSVLNVGKTVCIRLISHASWNSATGICQTVGENLCNASLTPPKCRALAPPLKVFVWVY